MFENAEKRVSKYGNISYWKDGIIIGKKCTKCGKDKPINEFGVKIKSKGTYQGQCKECMSLFHSEWYKTNSERIIKKCEEWRNNNVEKIKEYNKKRKEKQHVYAKEYRFKNEKRLKEYDKEKYKKRKKSNIEQLTNMLHQLNPILEKLDIKAYGSIYKITNTKTGRCYVGQTTQSLEARYSSNIIQSWIDERKHYNNQKFLDELENEENFTMKIINCGICQYHLDKLEAYYIDKYDSYNNGYNNNAGHYNTNDGLEEFEQILKENNLKFIDNELVEE